MAPRLEAQAELWAPTFVDGEMAQSLRETGPLNDMLRWAISLSSAERQMSTIWINGDVIRYRQIKALCETHQIEPFDHNPPTTECWSDKVGPQSGLRRIVKHFLKLLRAR